MTASVDFLPPAQPAPYPLHLREPLRQDYERLAALSRELGFEPRSGVAYLAIEELARYREAMRGYRAALADLGAVRWLPGAEYYNSVSF